MCILRRLLSLLIQVCWTMDGSKSCRITALELELLTPGCKIKIKIRLPWSLLYKCKKIFKYCCGLTITWLCYPLSLTYFTQCRYIVRWNSHGKYCQSNLWTFLLVWSSFLCVIFLVRILSLLKKCLSIFMPEWTRLCISQDTLLLQFHYFSALPSLQWSKQVYFRVPFCLCAA